jgi:putative DNA primase/helicase
MMVKIAVGENDMGHVDNRSVQWDKLADVLTKHQQADAKGGRFFVGGYFTGNERKEANLVERTLLTFDADAISMTLDDVELALRMNIDAAVAAYSTYNHAPDAPRLRIVIPLSRGVSAAEYRDLAKLVGDAIDIPFDACSYKANQFMYMPTCPDVSKAWSLCVEGKPLQVGGLP